MTLAACQKTELAGPADGGLQSITVSVPQSVSTKASGDGSHVNRCILEVYRGGTLYGERLFSSVSGGKATFDLRLVSNQTYDFVFWADKAEGDAASGFTDLYYATDNLSAIKAKKAYVANDEGFDAFTYCEKGYKVTGAFNLSVTLKRPFGQLNVSTLDLGEIKDESLKPTNVKVSFKSVPTAFNALTGEAGKEFPLDYTVSVSDVASGLLTVDYILASEAENATLADFSMTFLNNGTEICTNDAFTNIPLRRNYRTNVSGNLLTKKGTISVTVNPVFDGELPKEIAEVATVADVEQAIKDGATDITVISAPDANAKIKIPHTLTPEQAQKDIIIRVPATDKDIAIEYTADQSGEATLEIELFVETTGTLVINLPESSVTMRGSVGSLDATTADSTLTVPEDVTVGTLTLKAGSLKLYGVVNKLIKSEGYKGNIYRCIGSQKSFDNMLADKVSGYTQILAEVATEPVNGKNVVLTKPMTVSTDLNISNIRMEVPAGSADNGTLYGGYGCCAILVTDGASNAVFENVVSVGVSDVRPFLLSGTDAGVTVRNCTFITPIEANKAGFNIHCMADDSRLTANIENCLIGITETKLNTDKGQDYEYNSEMRTSVGAQTRGISITGSGAYKTGHVNLNIKGTAIECISYSINMAGYNAFVEADIDDCILDGRAALNLRGSNGSKWMVKNSKLIGRNWFEGSTEDFATIVYNYASDEAWWATRDHVVILDRTEIIAYSKPQTQTNWQYLADMRSPYRNRLELINGSKFREIYDPRLDYLVDITDPDVCEVVWDNTFVIEGKEGATVLPGWNGKEVEEVKPNAEGVYEISKAAQLAWIAAQVNNEGNTFEGKTIRLISDINLFNREWTPIGNGSRKDSAPVGKQFKGTFDGNRKTVSRYTIYTSNGNRDNALGLFGIVNGGTVKDFTIKNVDVYNDSEMAAAAVGMLTGGGVVSGVEVASGIVEVTRGNGGIVGRMTKSGTIKDCINRAKIIGTGANVGGIVGAAYYTAQGQEMLIENCKNYGTVTGSAGAVGGIVGLSAAKVAGCVNEADVTGNGADVAGIVAEQQNAGSVTNCINRGIITNKSTAYGTGGIIGWIRYNGSTANYPVKNVISVTGNENYGDVKGGNDAGGIVGTVYNLAEVNGNKNFANSLAAKIFAAGIVGNAQFNETAEGMTEPNLVNVKNNVSTTALTEISAECNDLYVYINDKDAVVAEGNTDVN